MLLLEDKRSYVYVYLDPRKKGPFQYGPFCFEYLPFYVGKGQDTRYKDHLKLVKKCNSFFYKRLNNMLKNNVQPIIIKLKENLTEKAAYSLEKTIVAAIGKIITHTGPLTNTNDGGGGKPIKSYEKTSKTAKELWQDDVYRNKILEGSRNNWKIIFPDKTEIVIRDLSAWCKVSKLNYSSCKAFSKRQVKYKNYCFINLDKTANLTSEDFRDTKKYSERRYKRNIYEVTKKNGEVIVVCDIQKFYKENKINASPFLSIVNTNQYYKNLFKAKILKTKVNICNNNTSKIEDIGAFYSNTITINESCSILKIGKHLLVLMCRSGLKKDRIKQSWRILKEDFECIKTFLKTHKFLYQITHEHKIHNLQVYRLEKAGLIVSTSLYGQKAFDLENYDKIIAFFQIPQLKEVI